jgi:CRISPR-associated protein Csm1
MSVQIFLRGKLLGIEDFVASPASGGDEVFQGRMSWIDLLMEVLPRALLAEFGLAKILLGTSGGDQFLVVLPSEYREQAHEFLDAASRDAAQMSGGALRLIWSVTENLGDWSDVRKRLNDELMVKQGTPAASGSVFTATEFNPPEDAYFQTLARSLMQASSVGWSPESPARILTNEGKHTWEINAGAESILFARHRAPEGADGRNSGVLRGDVDDFGIRLRRLQTVEEHLQLSMMYKQFFAGELQLLCSSADFWQRVSILYSGGDDFAVYGAWDALIPLAREVQRVFHRFASEYLKDLPGPEGKTITMALALSAGDLAATYGEAGRNLELAKNSDKDCMYALGRILEWKQLADAAELKEDLTALVARSGSSPGFLNELCGIYRETAGTRSSRRSRASDRPWRFYRRLSRVLPAGRDRETQKMRQNLMEGLLGRNPANVKLRPSGRVALEWARLLEEQTPLTPASSGSRHSEEWAGPSNLSSANSSEEQTEEQHG